MGGSQALENRFNTHSTFFLCFAEGPLPSVLQEVSLPIITNNECEGMYRKAGYIEHIPNIFICAGYSSGGKDSCEVIHFHTTLTGIETFAALVFSTLKKGILSSAT